MTAWVYWKTEGSFTTGDGEYCPGVWTVGFYSPDGEWHPESDFNSTEEAARRCHYLNGGKDHEQEN